MGTGWWLSCPPLDGDRGRKKLFGGSGPERNGGTEVSLSTDVSSSEGLRGQPHPCPSQGWVIQGSLDHELHNNWDFLSLDTCCAPTGKMITGLERAFSRLALFSVIISKSNLIPHFHQQHPPPPLPGGFSVSSKG